MEDNAELELLRSNFRGVLQQEWPIEHAFSRLAGNRKAEQALWETVAELGWLGLSIAEDHGGMGMGFAPLAVLYQECGRVLSPLPLLPTMMFAEAIAIGGTQKQQAEWLPRISAGQVRAAVDAQSATGAMQLRREDDHVVVSGESSFMLGGGGATAALICASDSSRQPVYVIIDLVADNCAFDTRVMADGTRDVATLRLNQLYLGLDRCLDLDQSARLAVALHTHALLGTACDAAGGAEAIFDTTLEYLCTRQQFDRPIGSFQALKHRAADHKTALVASAAILNHASAVRSGGEPDLLSASAAKGLACEAFAATAADAIQMHGGIGFTWEHRAHLYLKRAKLDEQLFSSGESCFAAVTDEFERRLLPAVERSDDVDPNSAAQPLQHRDDLEAFRRSFRNWLKAHVPADWRTQMLGASEEDYVAFSRQWFDKLHSVGLTTPHWPKDWGGAELSFAHQIVVAQELAKADAPSLGLFIVSLYHLPATLFEHGTQEQRDRYLEGARDQRVIWCQGFSEPGAGSDLASLRTRAERRGDVFVVNGQKVWSTWGQFAQYCLLLVRTDRDAPRKQAGISYLIMDMNSPGVTVRPIKQITGESEFTEIFLDNVEIPVGNLIGAENAGWGIAQSTLSAERGLLVFEVVERAASACERDLRNGRGGWAEDPQFRREFGRCEAQLIAVQILIQEMLAQNTEEGAASNLPVFIKLHWATLLQRYTELMVRTAGLPGQVGELPLMGGGLQTGVPMADYPRSFAWTIPGGTNEVMRNIIAEKILGLPKG